MVLTDAFRVAREVDIHRERQRLAWTELLDWATDGAGLSEQDLELGPSRARRVNDAG